MAERRDDRESEPVATALARAVVADEARRSATSFLPMTRERRGRSESEAASAAKRSRGEGGQAGEEAARQSQLLGKGYFGCAYSPPIPCPDGRFAELTGDASKISKYGAWADLSKEMFVYRQLNRLDPEFRWHLAFYGGCIVPNREYVKRFADAPCDTEFLGRTSGPHGLLYMDRGSASLMDMMDGKAPLPPNADLARSAENLVRGLMVMAENGIVYGDVGENNLVFGADGILRFIDFAGVGITDPDKAKLLMAGDLESVQGIVRDAMDAFPERARSHPEESELLRNFVGARLWYAGKPLVTPEFRITHLPEDPHPRNEMKGPEPRRGSAPKELRSEGAQGEGRGVALDESMLEW
jgi:hypothetical protein